MTCELLSFTAQHTLWLGFRHDTKAVQNRLTHEAFAQNKCTLTVVYVT